ncbi:uncharacterized protein LOC117340075 [Pecten maximus]|uniref:uncharacterized protein LOC117340075 n=1 Tax=Pecten maximus TaxID=6579 RepID=UPI001458E3DC|nr:uncharacterized protein LOC117340075 [Pecten maximus]
MWRILLSGCYLWCLLRPGSTLMVPNQQRADLNAAIRQPLLQQATMVQGIVSDITNCQNKISQKYHQCALCLKGIYTERYPTEVLSTEDALMFLCFYTGVKYETCQIILNPERIILELRNRASKNVQHEPFSELKPPKDAELMLHAFQNIQSERRAFEAAANIRKTVTEAEMSLQTPKEKARAKRWIPFLKMMKAPRHSNHTFTRVAASYMEKYLNRKRIDLKPIVKRTRKTAAHRGKRGVNRDGFLRMIPNCKTVRYAIMNFMRNMSLDKNQRATKRIPFVKMTKAPRDYNSSFTQKHTSYMDRYLNRKIIGMKPILKRTRTSAHFRGKRWINLISGAPSGKNIGNAITNMMGNIQKHASFSNSGIQCNDGKCKQIISDCAALSFPDPTKNMILNVCGQRTQRSIDDISKRLKSMKEILHALTTHLDFI